MNQQCKVCGEPAAGFHFGAFTCEGCKSFFGRSYNNLGSISECKNNSECVINKKNRTACKACRLRKCLLVGMSKSGSRYGRRSNWFKIHCLLQEQQQQQQAQAQAQQAQAQTQTPGAPPLAGGNPLALKTQPQRTPPPPPHNHLPHHHHHHHHHVHPHHHHHHPHHPLGLGLLNPASFPPPPLLHLPKTKEELLLLGLDDYKHHNHNHHHHHHAPSPSVSSPESHNSDSSVEVSDARRIPIFPGFLPPSFLPPAANLLFPSGYAPLYPGLLQPATTTAAAAATATATTTTTTAPINNNNNNNRLMRNHNPGVEAFSKRIFLDAVLQSQRSPAGEARVPVQDDPIDLSMRALSERDSSPAPSDRSTAASEMALAAAGAAADAEDGEESDCESERDLKRVRLATRPTPLDLTTKA